MRLMPTTTDEQLLLATPKDPEAFGVFYDRHHLPLLRAMRARTGSTETALDITAETFASALRSVPTFVPQGTGSARAWLYGIARNRAADAYRNGRTQDEARRSLAMQPLSVTDTMIEELDRRLDAARSGVLEALEELGVDERAAVTARVLGESHYGEIADRLQVSESVVRQRVSRGLRKLRNHIEETG